MSNSQELDVFGRVFRLKTDIRQGSVAAWNRVYAARGANGVRAPFAVERQAALEAGIEAGWILEPECRAEEVTDIATGVMSKRYIFDGVAVDDLLPAEVNHYGGQCSRLFDRLMSIPKATSST